MCVHNAGRSQMAAALLDHLAGGRVKVRSAGSEPADRINPRVRWLVGERRRGQGDAGFAFLLSSL